LIFCWLAYNEDASYLSYKKRVSTIPKDEEEYDKQKETLGDKFFQTANSLDIGQTFSTTPDGVHRMAAELVESQKSRYNFSRRRTFHDDKDVDYINEPNKKFNEKLARAYNAYTVEIRQNLERGTAI
jgi:pre-mRNA-splicing factor SYF2